MDMAFVKALNMSISASWLVLMVLVLRLLLKKSPKWISVALWALVAVRLICPFSIESPVSLMPSTQTVPEEVFYMEPVYHSQNVSLQIVEPRPNVDPVDVDLGKTVNHIQTWELKWSLLWPAGMLVMMLWAGISYMRLKRKVDASIDVGNGVFICDYIDTPFILGVIKPKIYLPSSMEPDSASHVLAHERAHIARKDHWWKPFGYLLLTVYWFNPVLWLAYILLCRDIELACDEKVIRDMELPQKKAYSEALLKCSVNRRHVAACPLAFGEVGVKERVKTVLNYKKPTFWIVLIAVLALIVTAVCFLTDPVKGETRTYRVEEVVYRNPLISYYMTEENAPQFQITGDSTLRLKEQDEEWKDLGELSQIRLSDVKFDALFLELEQGQSREENREAWLLYVPPGEESNGIKFYLFWQESGGCYMAEGMSFPSVFPPQESVLDSTHTVNWLYRLCDANTFREFGESPYIWTSTVESQDFDRAWAKPYSGATYTITLEGSRLEELVGLLNEIQEEEIVIRKSSGIDDPRWNYDGAFVTFFCSDGTPIMIRYADDTVMIDAETGSGIWETDGYWVIENEAFQQWMRSISLGGTEMLSDENRAEIRQLLRMEQVQFFDPREYDDLLFVGCAYDNGRGLGVAVYEPLADGYRLLKLIRGDEVKTCASGSELYYCDYNDLRIFLILNQNITGMEWAGAYEASYAIDTHPGLIVNYFPETLDALYRFCYGGDATTMYMDWENQTHGQAQEYADDALADPDDAYRVCANLKLSDVNHIWASEVVDLGDGYEQAFTLDFSRDQFVELLNLLHNLPEDVFQADEYLNSQNRRVEIYLRNETGYMLGYPYLTLIVNERAMYYQFSVDSENYSQIWKIDSPELVRYIESFFVEDKSDWNRFAPFPKMDGKISCKFGDVEIVIPKYAGFQYEVNVEGIRLKPKEESGWVLLQYLDRPYTVDEPNVKFLGANCFGLEAVKGYYEGSEYWSFMDIAIPEEEKEHHLLLLNAENASWVEAYNGKIGWFLAVDEIEFRAAG